MRLTTIRGPTTCCLCGKPMGNGTRAAAISTPGDYSVGRACIPCALRQEREIARKRAAPQEGMA